MRRSALEAKRALEGRGASGKEAAARIGIARTTLAGWERREDRPPVPRGRPPRRASREERRSVLSVLESEGQGLGVPSLQELFPELARRELEELSRRRSYALRRRCRESLVELCWPVPGTVWAADFTNTPCPVDGLYGKLSLVRDLASHAQLEARPAPAENAAEVALDLEQLFALWGPPLVLKQDNGPGFVAESTRLACEEHGVLILYSPPYMPSYNGSCEAGCGSIKHRTARIAAAAGRPAAWCSDDVERARLQANSSCRVGGPRGPTPDEMWTNRPPITDELRTRFLATYRRYEGLERCAEGLEENVTLPRPLQGIIDRRAISKALIEHGFLEFRRRR